MDSASLPVQTEKKVSRFGFSGGDITMRACFHIFGRVYLSLGANPLSHFLAEVFLKTGL